MDTFYEVLDTASGMPLKEFDTLNEAVDDLRRELLYSDPEALLGLTLLRVENGKSKRVAMRQELLNLVRFGPSSLNQASKVSQTIAMKPRYDVLVERVVIQDSTSTTHWGTYCAA